MTDNTSSNDPEATIPDTLTAVQRARIIEDMVCLQAEYAYHGKQEFEAPEITEFVSQHASMTPDDLHESWMGFVGEWLASRHDMPPADSSFARDAFEPWCTAQWNALVAGEDRDYGFVLTVTVDERDVVDAEQTA